MPKPPLRWIALAISVRPDPRIGLVDRDHLDVDVVAEHASGVAIAGDSIEHRQRIGWYGRAQPLDDIAVVVIMRRLDQVE